jgi:hypothetical protein
LKDRRRTRILPPPTKYFNPMKPAKPPPIRILGWQLRDPRALSQSPSPPSRPHSTPTRGFGRHAPSQALITIPDKQNKKSGKLCLTSDTSRTLGSVRVRRGLGGHPLVISGWKGPQPTPTPAFLAWFHPATQHLDLDERFGDSVICGFVDL